MSTTEEKVTNNRDAGGKRSSRSEDAKAKERGRRSGKSRSKTPGVESVKDDGPVGRSRLEDAKAKERDRREGSRKSRSKQERDAKAKARSRKPSSSSQPGVYEENASSDTARKKRSSKSSQPGVSHEKRSSDRARRKEQRSGSSVEARPSRSGGKKDDKKGFRNRGATTPGVQSERIDRRADRKASSGMNSAIGSNIASNLDDGYAVHATTIGDDDSKFDEYKKSEEEEAKPSPQLWKEEQQREEKERKAKEEEEKRKKRRRMTIVVLLLVFVLIAGGIAAYFMTQGGSNTEPIVKSSAGNAVDNEKSPVSEAPSTDPSSSPTGNFFKYPKPDEEACQRLQDGIPFNGTSVMRGLEVDFDLGLSSTDQEIATELPDVEQKIADWLIGRLVGCEGFQRRLDVQRYTTSTGISVGEMRQLQTADLNALRYMIADVLDIQAIDQEDDCSTSSNVRSPNCSFVKVKMNLQLRGNERAFDVVNLISTGFFPPGKDLSREIGLSDNVDIFVPRVGGIRAPVVDPTNAPSTMPSQEPSAVPSGSGGGGGGGGGGLQTTIPQTASPTAVTTAPSATPSFAPSNVPSLAPTPTPAPTLADATPLPTQLPSRTPSHIPSIMPSQTPSMFPSSSPSAAPVVETSSPSTMPSISPSITPSIAPQSKEPTATPIVVPTSAPTSGPTSGPTSAPTSGPTSAPTSAPTSGPTSRPTLEVTSAPVLRFRRIKEQDEQNGPGIVQDYTKKFKRHHHHHKGNKREGSHHRPTLHKMSSRKMNFDNSEELLRMYQIALSQEESAGKASSWRSPSSPFLSVESSSSFFDDGAHETVEVVDKKATEQDRITRMEKEKESP